MSHKAYYVVTKELNAFSTKREYFWTGAKQLEDIWPQPYWHFLCSEIALIIPPSVLQAAFFPEALLSATRAPQISCNEDEEAPWPGLAQGGAGGKGPHPATRESSSRILQRPGESMLRKETSWVLNPGVRPQSHFCSQLSVWMQLTHGLLSMGCLTGEWGEVEQMLAFFSALLQLFLLSEMLQRIIICWLQSSAQFLLLPSQHPPPRQSELIVWRISATFNENKTE